MRSRTRFLAAGLSLAFLAATLLLAPSSPAATSNVPPSEDYPRLPNPSCVTGDQRVPQHAVVCHLVPFVKAQPTVVLWGDSHAWMLIPGFVRQAEKEHVNPDVFTLGACPPLLVPKPAPGEHFGSKCEKQNYHALQYVLKLQRADHPVRVLIAGNWVGYRQIYRESKGGTVPTNYEPYAVQMSVLSHKGTPAMFRRLGEEGTDVDVVGQILTVPRPPDYCIYGMDPYVCDMPRARAIPEEAKTRAWVDLQMSKLTGRSRYIDVNDAVCDDVTCHGMVGDTYTFFDPMHLSATFSRTLHGKFGPTLRNFS